MGSYIWKRDNKPLDSDVSTTKRQLFSFCGKGIGHFPVCGWLRPSCSYLKRLCNDLGWDDSIPENCDASGVAVGVVVEINGNVIEDTSWLRKMDDDTHINLAELEAVIKGVNIAISNKFSKIKILTDSSSVRAWVACAIMRDKPISTRGLGQALVRRRVSLLHQILEEYEIDATIEK
ncbi:hypothetical protein GJ496_001777 [Pomphorhynchus laevis]|nr:hypothetical protein GJ496_001777 [Pomphorhynchus laevis]